MKNKKHKEKDKLVLDLETQHTFSEVGGRNFRALKVSLVGVYSYLQERLLFFTEDRLHELFSLMEAADLIIGFNLKRFDYVVLEPYRGKVLDNFPTLDILEEIEIILGHRLKLDELAKYSLGRGKSGDGLDAVRYFRNGEFDKLKSYCGDDVLITRDLYEYGKNNGFVLYRQGLIPIRWGRDKQIIGTLNEAFTKKLTVDIDYFAPWSSDSTQRRRRQVDIYALDSEGFIAFCHLRKSIRNFKIKRVIDAVLVENHYIIPQNLELKDLGM